MAVNRYKVAEFNKTASELTDEEFTKG